MKKVGTITFHRAINYGGILQAYALQQKLFELGIDNEIIDYRCPFIERLYRPKIKDKFSKLYIKRFLSALLKGGSVKFNLSGFKDFTDKYLTVSKKVYNTPEDLSKSEYDVYIAGSDQVWSYYCAGFDKSYFLNFVDDEKKRISYAASFGVDSIPEEFKTEYTTLLKKFDKISVRENTGKEIVKSLLGSDCDVVPDPTMLLSKEQWKSIMPSERVVAEKYVLVYLLETNQRILEQAKKYAQEKGFKVVYITNNPKKIQDVTSLKNVSPQQWLNLFYNAEYVFTNSFHGIAFSINFEKPIYVEYLNSNSKVNTRIEYLLSRYNKKSYLNNITGCDDVVNDENERMLTLDREHGTQFLINNILR